MNVPKRIDKSPPDKGSFPIDRDNLCKLPMINLLKCLKSSDFNNELCRDHTRDYLNCRMKHGLMAEEDWKNLGFSDNKQGSSFK